MCADTIPTIHSSSKVASRYNRKVCNGVSFVTEKICGFYYNTRMGPRMKFKVSGFGFEAMLWLALTR